MKIILASNSPRRKELLEKHNIEFEVIPSDITEEVDSLLTPYENVMNLAKQKALDVYKKYHRTPILAADTIVVLDNLILGKPKDELDAYNMLSSLSGRTHEVVTGVAFVKNGELKLEYCVSEVTFKTLTEEDIKSYIATKEPMDKAGSYAIQGIGSKLIESYEGDFDNIVGLPMSVVLKFLK